MKKYFHIYKTTLIEELQYSSKLIFGFISYFIIIFVFFNLWKYLYSDGVNLIKGYDFSQMMWYVIITEILWYSSKNKTIVSGITEDIKSGNVAYNINKPYSYPIYIIFKHLGEITIKSILFGIIAIGVNFIFIGPLIGFSFLNLPFIFITVILSILINSILRIIISVLSFFIEDSTPFHWIYDKFILVLGVLFPIELFPKFIQPVIRWSPVFVVTYGPAKLVIDFSFSMFNEILIIQSIYLVISLLILYLLYRKGVKKLNVNGG